MVWYSSGSNNEQAGKFALIWFGSLSILAALAGPVTAVTALSLQHIANVKRLSLKILKTRQNSLLERDLPILASPHRSLAF